MPNCLRNLLLLSSEKKNAWGWQKTLPKFLIKLSKLLLVFGVAELLWSSDMYFFVKEWKIQFALESVKRIISFYWPKGSLSCCNNPVLMEIWDIVAQILKGTDEIGRLFLSLHLLAQGCTVVASVLTPIETSELIFLFSLQGNNYFQRFVD